MAVTIKIQSDSGDIDVSQGKLLLLQGPQATKQNIEQAMKTVRGTWGGNISSVGFPYSIISTLGIITSGIGGSPDLGAFASLIRIFFRNDTGIEGITGVSSVVEDPQVSHDARSATVYFEVTVLDETSQPLPTNGKISLAGGGVE